MKSMHITAWFEMLRVPPELHYWCIFRSKKVIKPKDKDEFMREVDPLENTLRSMCIVIPETTTTERRCFVRLMRCQEIMEMCQ